MSRSLLWSFLPSLYQNDYDTEKVTDEFNQMHGVKKRCKSCVDKMMKEFDNSLKILSDKEVWKSYDKGVHQFFTNNNKPEDIQDSDTIVIDENDDNDMVDENEYDDEVL